MPALAPGIAARNAPQREVAASRCAVLVQRLQRIGRTGWREPACIAHPRTQQQAVAFD